MTVKIKIINRCADCELCSWPSHKALARCAHEEAKNGNQIEDTSQIPSWCPLPDKDEK